METLGTVVLPLHIAAGFIALGAGLVALAIKMLDLPHRWHVPAGRMFAVAMVTVALSAVVLAALGAGTFLLLIAVFSLYLVLSGWSYARNRSGVPGTQDRLRAGAMVLASIIMLGYGTALVLARDPDGATMLVFGGIGAALSVGDVRLIRAGGVRGTARIGRHLTMMVAGLIAAVTAFLVVNVEIQPMVIVWLAPTFVLTPAIVAMNRKVRRSPSPRTVPPAVLETVPVEEA